MTAVRKLMTGDEFLVWCLDREGRWELVGGEPVLAMAGAAKRHDRIVVNLLVALRPRLKGGPCDAQTSDIASRMVNGNIRRPDVTVDGGPYRPEALESAEPAVFFEVLSPSTQSIDAVRKAEEYRQIAPLKHFALLVPDRPFVILWSRTTGEWRSDEIDDVSAALELAGIGVSLPMAEIYEEVVFKGDAPSP